MLKEIKQFYEKTKLKEVEAPNNGENIPVEYIHIFQKNYPRLPSIKLRREPFDGEFEKLLKIRRSTRDFSETPVPISAVSNMLKSCSIIGNGSTRRTYPSAGARYPIELYLIAFNIEGIARGVYHFNSSKFTLELLLLQDLRSQEAEIVCPYLKNTGGAFIFTSVVSRSEVKYKYKAYPYSLIEAGHMAQNVILAACKYGVGICPVGGFINDYVSRLLDLSEEEQPLYVLGFGKPRHDNNKK